MPITKKPIMRHELEVLEARLLLADRPFNLPIHPPFVEPGHEIEPNDTIETATPLAHFSLGRPCFIGPDGVADCPPEIFQGAGTLGGDPAHDGDVDFFAFSTIAGGRVTMRVSGPAVEQGGTFELLTAGGRVLGTAEAHDTNGDGTPDVAVLEISSHDGGDLFVRVRSEGDVPAAGLEYAVGVNVRRDEHVEHEPNDSFETANDIELTWSTPEITGLPDSPPIRPAIWSAPDARGEIRGNLDDRERSQPCFSHQGLDCLGFVPDTDFFRFMAWPYFAIEISARGAGAQGGHLTIYDQEQNVVGEADPNADGELAFAFDSTYEGPYFAQLTDMGTVACITAPCLTYELRVEERRELVDPFAEQEPNDTLETANPLHEVRPLLHFAEVDQAIRRWIDAIELQPDGDVICLAIGCGDPNWWDRTRAVFLVRGDLSTPTDGADTDYFSFAAGENRNIVVSYNGVAAGDLELLDGDGNVLAQTTSSPGDGGEDNPNHGAIEFFTPVGGTLYVHLSRSADGAPTRASNYGLRVTTQFEPNAEHEPNDTLDTANEIELRGRFDWPCDLVCPLADATGVAIDPAETDATNEDPAASDDLHAIRWPGDETLHGFISGELEFFTCPPEMVCIAVVQHGVDNFVFDVPAEQLVSIRLTGPLAHNNAVLALLDGAGTVQTSDDDGSDGLAVEWRAREGGTFYARVTAGFPTVELQVADTVARAVACDNTSALAGSLCTSPWSYRMDVTAEPLPNPIEGKDEHEPNDTIDEATHLELRPDRSDDWGVELRERVAHGVAGGPTHDVDFFSFDVRAGEDVTVGLGCVPGFDLRPIVIRPGDPIDLPVDPPIDEPNPITTPVLVVVVFDSEGNEIDRTGIAGSENVLFHSDSDGVHYAMMMLEQGAPAAEPTPYELHIHTRLIDVEGPDETEPNDTFEQANTLELNHFPTFAPGLELRGGDARGVAGGPTGDVDNFKFDIRAGEHVSVDVQGLAFDGTNRSAIDGWLRDHNLNDFGDAIGTVYAGGTPLFSEAAGHAIISRFGYILAHHPELNLGNVQVTVFDAAGNQVGASQSGDRNVVAFDASADATYFAVVSAIADSPVHYRLGVLARSDFDPTKVDPNSGGGETGDPFVVVLGPRQSFTFADSNGDDVVIQFRGSTGKATITFTDSEADGSDIASVDINGARKNGSLTIHTAGSAEVGEIAIHGPATSAAGARRRGGSGRTASFGTIDVDGNVGHVASDLNIRSLVVDGMLGDLDAHNRQIGEVRAETFDAAFADVGSIRTLHVAQDSANGLFTEFLPWEDPQV